MGLDSLLSSMSLADIVGGFIFSGVGFLAFMHGKKEGNLRSMILGGLLMVYPYFISGTVAMYAVGAALTAALYYSREG